MDGTIQPAPNIIERFDCSRRFVHGCHRPGPTPGAARIDFLGEESGRKAIKKLNGKVALGKKMRVSKVEDDIVHVDAKIKASGDFSLVPSFVVLKAVSRLSVVVVCCRGWPEYLANLCQLSLRTHASRASEPCQLS
jgi:RNA recognition motif-containing protein